MQNDWSGHAKHVVLKPPWSERKKNKANATQLDPFLGDASYHESAAAEEGAAPPSPPLLLLDVYMVANETINLGKPRVNML